MPISIVVGGQFGSEGKGKVAHYFAQKLEASYVVRCGGSNSGHTVIDQQGKERIFQHLPTAAILPEVKLAICAGSYINVDILLKEIKETGVTPDRLIIDPDAVIITDELKKREQSSGLTNLIGSTGSGTGAAVAARVNREDSLLFAKDVQELSLYIQDVPDILRGTLDNKERVIIEGTQGFGLSLVHSRYYPHVTSRDTTAAGFLAETGLSPLDVDSVILTIRAFPIRVSSKNAGPLPQEIDWETITKEGFHSKNLKEITSVTKQIRRVGRFHKDIVNLAIKANKPTTVVLNHLDYICNKDNKNYRELLMSCLRDIEISIEQSISYVGLGPGTTIQINEFVQD